MYIHNINGDSGMATLLQNSKNIVNVGVGNSILVGNVINGGTTSLMASNVINSGPTTPGLLTSITPAATITSYDSTFVLPHNSQSFFIPNTKSDSSSSLTYEQPQQQQQQLNRNQQQTQQPQQQAPKIIFAPNTVHLSIANSHGLTVLARSGGDGVTVTSSVRGINTTTSTGSINQGTYFVTASNVIPVNGYQQQLHQQINNNAQIVQQQPQRQQKLVINSEPPKLIFNQHYNSFNNTNTRSLTPRIFYSKAPLAIINTQTEQQKQQKQNQIQPVDRDNVVLQQVSNGSSESSDLINGAKRLKKANPPHSQIKSLQKQSQQTLRCTSKAINQINHRAIVLNRTKASAKIVATISKAAKVIAATSLTTSTSTAIVKKAVSITAISKAVSIGVTTAPKIAPTAASTLTNNSTHTVGFVADNNQIDIKNEIFKKSSTTTESLHPIQILQSNAIDTNIDNNTINNNGTTTVIYSNATSDNNTKNNEYDNIINKITSNKNGFSVNNSHVGTSTNKKSVAIVPPSVWIPYTSSAATTLSSNALFNSPISGTNDDGKGDVDVGNAVAADVPEGESYSITSQRSSSPNSNNISTSDTSEGDNLIPSSSDLLADSGIESTLSLKSVSSLTSSSLSSSTSSTPSASLAFSTYSRPLGSPTSSISAAPSAFSASSASSKSSTSSTFSTLSSLSTFAEIDDLEKTTTPSSSSTTTDDTVSNEEDGDPEIDIIINNVVCSFSLRCHLNLREIALFGANVEYRRENGMVTMKLRHPYTTASIWSSGRITCTGATSESQAKVAARRYARSIQKLGFPVRFGHFRIVNVLGTCCMPWAIKIVNFSKKYKEANYEPELHPGVTYKMDNPRASLKIFSTGSITITAGSVASVQAAIEYIYPLLHEFRKKRSPECKELMRIKKLMSSTTYSPRSKKEAILASISRFADNKLLDSQPIVLPKQTSCDNMSMDIDDAPNDLVIDDPMVMYDPIDQTEDHCDDNEYNDISVDEVSVGVGDGDGDGVDVGSADNNDIF